MLALLRLVACGSIVIVVVLTMLVGERLLLAFSEKLLMFRVPPKVDPDPPSFIFFELDVPVILS